MIFNIDFNKSKSGWCPRPPDAVSAVWKTFKECQELGSIRKINQTRFWFLPSRSPWSNWNLTAILKKVPHTEKWLCRDDIVKKKQVSWAFAQDLLQYSESYPSLKKCHMPKPQGASEE